MACSEGSSCVPFSLVNEHFVALHSDAVIISRSGITISLITAGLQVLTKFSGFADKAYADLLKLMFQITSNQ